uniref:Trafficking protein particle complex III-specific subunit 85 n=1 Tax=Lygus hesperus TaxID=30085 RepID=A0A0A9XDK3_LYGHE
MKFYLNQSIYKHLEKRLHALDIIVQDRRTTTLSKVASWFTGSKDDKKKSSTTLDVVLRRSDHASVYVSSALEMQMRHCGDLSMFLQDFNGAVTYYKMCIDELL